MSEEPLKGVYKELWIEYQNAETIAVQDLTYDQLNERISKWESIEFEARAKRQKDIAEKRTRDIAKAKAGRDALITDPHYTPSDSPSSKGSSEVVKVKAARQTKEEKLKGSLGELGVDLKDLLAEVKRKKSNSNGNLVVKEEGK